MVYVIQTQWRKRITSVIRTCKIRRDNRILVGRWAKLCAQYFPQIALRFFFLDFYICFALATVVRDLHGRVPSARSGFSVPMPKSVETGLPKRKTSEAGDSLSNLDLRARRYGRGEKTPSDLAMPFRFPDDLQNSHFDSRDGRLENFGTRKICATGHPDNLRETFFSFSSTEGMEFGERRAIISSSHNSRV